MLVTPPDHCLIGCPAARVLSRPEAPGALTFLTTGCQARPSVEKADIERVILTRLTSRRFPPKLIVS